MIRASAIFGAAVVSLLTSLQVSAQVKCGDEITEDAALESSLECDTNPALTVVGPASLDLAGFTVFCTANVADGIHLSGNARLEDGAVFGCNDGVRIEGNSAVVTNVTARDNARYGFDVFGVDVLLVGNEATLNDSDGFYVVSDGARLINNIASQNKNGFWVNGIESVITGNLASDNRRDGIRVIRISPKTTVTGNTTVRNRGNGIKIRSRLNQVYQNTVNSNRKAGIVLTEGARNNFIIGNDATGNGIDLQDDNTSCDDNEWLGNTGDGNQSCIR